MCWEFDWTSGHSPHRFKPFVFVSLQRRWRSPRGVSLYCGGGPVRRKTELFYWTPALLAGCLRLCPSGVLRASVVAQEEETHSKMAATKVNLDKVKEKWPFVIFCVLWLIVYHSAHVRGIKCLRRAFISLAVLKSAVRWRWRCEMGSCCCFEILKKEMVYYCPSPTRSCVRWRGMNDCDGRRLTHAVFYIVTHLLSFIVDGKMGGKESEGIPCRFYIVDIRPLLSNFARDCHLQTFPSSL